MALAEETTELAMSLCATLAAADIADALGCGFTDALEQLLESETGCEIYDDSLKLWWESPRDVAVMYFEESGLPVPAGWRD